MRVFAFVDFYESIPRAVKMREMMKRSRKEDRLGKDESAKIG